MTNEEAKEFTMKVFEHIKNSTTIKDLETIPDPLEIPEKYRMKTELYPKIEFNINPKEIASLIKSKILDEDLNFKKMDKLTISKNPLAKILYAIAWKNGDLKKVKHILKGIRDSKDENSNQEDALVFYQFGKYLTKTHGEPIIDQHVIRAFAIYYSEIKKHKVDKPYYNEGIEKLRKIESITKKHQDIITDYKEWLKSKELTSDLKTKKDYTYHIDKLLFATGKTIKFRESKK